MIVYFAIILIALLGFCGLAIDVGRLELRTNQLQAAADAGALAGAGELMHGSNTNDASSAAYNDVVQVATANGIPAPTLAGQLGSSFGFYVGDNSVVEVQLTQSVPTFFLGLISRASSSMTVSVKADAQVPPCMLFMGNPTMPYYGNSIDFWIASSSMHAPLGCPTYYKDGLFIDGFAYVASSQVRISGGSGNSVLSGWTTFPVIFAVPVIPDPLAYVTAPTAGSCINATPMSKLNQSSSTTISLTPGTYCGKTAAYTGTARCNTNSYPITPAIDIQGTQSTTSCPNQSWSNGGNCTTTPRSTSLPVFMSSSAA